MPSVTKSCRQWPANRRNEIKTWVAAFCRAIRILAAGAAKEPITDPSRVDSRFWLAERRRRTELTGEYDELPAANLKPPPAVSSATWKKAEKHYAFILTTAARR